MNKKLSASSVRKKYGHNPILHKRKLVYYYTKENMLFHEVSRGYYAVPAGSLCVLLEPKVGSYEERRLKEKNRNIPKGSGERWGLVGLGDLARFIQRKDLVTEKEYAQIEQRRKGALRSLREKSKGSMDQGGQDG